MSGILKRTIYYYPGDHYYGKKLRFVDWASVVTGIGQCHEPWSGTNWFPGGGMADLDYEDMISGVDKIKATNRTRMELFIVDESGQPIHGGLQWPRKSKI